MCSRCSQYCQVSILQSFVCLQKVTVLVIAAFLRVSSATTAFTSNFILINNSVPSEKRGAMNGLGMTLGSLGKSIGPAVGSVIFAWTLTNGIGFPLDYHFIFYLGGLIAALVSLMTFWLPPSLEKSYESVH